MVKRSEKAKKLEEAGGMFNWIKARIIEPAGRSGKRAHDWEESAERLHEVMEESYSTSSSRAGQAKIAATLTMKGVEHRSEAKAAAKLAERLKENRTASDTFEEIVHDDEALHHKMEEYDEKKEEIVSQENALKNLAEKDWL